MSEKRKEYIDQLLSDLKRLEERLLSVKENDTLPFSFFSASFDRIEKISRSLHELELMQIGEMKTQMERLVRFLSESDGRNSAVREPEVYEEKKEEKKEAEEEVSGNRENAPRNEPEAAEGIFTEQERVRFTERVVLPEYKDPRTIEAVPLPAGAVPDLSEKNGKEKPVTRSLNDIIQAPTALLDLKRGISLNDRFLFQRELFNNNRSEMNSVMDRLSTFANFGDIENYLKSELGWNFEDRTVKEFLLVIKKGFE